MERMKPWLLIVTKMLDLEYSVLYDIQQKTYTSTCSLSIRWWRPKHKYVLMNSRQHQSIYLQSQYLKIIIKSPVIKSMWQWTMRSYLYSNSYGSTQMLYFRESYCVFSFSLNHVCIYFELIWFVKDWKPNCHYQALRQLSWLSSCTYLQAITFAD